MGITYVTFSTGIPSCAVGVAGWANSPCDYGNLGPRVLTRDTDLEEDSEDYAQKTDFDFLNGINHPVLQATGRGIHTAFGQREFDGVGLSVRYDFHPSAAFKADYFKGTDSRATVDDYQLVSFRIDLVF